MSDYKERSDCKEIWEDDCKKPPKHEEDGSCVIINIYCDKCKNDHKPKEYDFECDSKKGPKPTDDKSCVVINVFCECNKK